jgi:hypothetical protein
MLRWVRITKAALGTASAVAVCLVFGTVCSVDRAGLSNTDASASSGGSTGGNLSATGGASAAGSGGTLGGSGNSGSGGSGSGGSAGSNATGGSGVGSGGLGSGGTLALGGATGSGGDLSGTGGAQGTGGIEGAGGDVGSGGLDGGSGGLDGGPGGATATGGVGGTGGAAGGAGVTGGSGGAQGSGGKFGTGGSGGGHPPNCSSFPASMTFTPPTDNVLHCYWTHSDAAAWDIAEATCQNEGGTLATILSSQENMAVLSFALRATLFAGGTNVVWLGATDGKQDNDKSGPGKYAWVTGEPWGYTNWHSSQPDGSCTCQTNNTCACDHWLAISNDGTWYDRDDSSGRPYVCEAPAR